MKAEAPETRALLQVVRTFDPHLVMDLHTTDCSYHGYHLTYATSLSPNTDPRLDRFAREQCRRHDPGPRARHGRVRIFDYGNLTRVGAAASGPSCDHRPRFGTNMLGLRNRVAVLSEAYSYLPFAERIAVTRAFVLGVVDSARAAAPELMALTARLDADLVDGRATLFGDQTRLCEPRLGSARGGGRGGPARGPRDAPGGPHRLADPARGAAGPLHGRTPAGAARRLGRCRTDGGGSSGARSPRGPLRDPTAERAARLQRFVIADVRRAERLFQGHHEVALGGSWEPGPDAVPERSLVVPSVSRSSAWCARALEPESEDSLFTWNHFDARLRVGSLPGPARRALDGD